MNKEVKIGLSVIFVLLVVFAGVLVYKLRTPADEAVASAETDAGESQTEDKPVYASGPTVLAANDKPESMPRGDLRSPNKAAPHSADRYPTSSGHTTAGATGKENGDEHRPTFMPKVPPPGGDAGAQGDAAGAGDDASEENDRYGRKDRYTRQKLLTEKTVHSGVSGSEGAAGDEQPSEASLNGKVADNKNNAGAKPDDAGEIVDPFARRSGGARDGKLAADREGLLRADDVQLTPNPRQAADATHPGNPKMGNPKAGDINTTAGDDGATADPFVPRKNSTSAADIYGDANRRRADDFDRAAQSGAAARDPADLPPDERMPYRDNLGGSPDARQQLRADAFAEPIERDRSWQQGETYTVEPNDSYWTISQKVYGTGGYFKAIQRHNQPKTGRMTGLNVGQTLSVPAAEMLAQKYPELCPKPRGRTGDRGQMMPVAAGARDQLAGGGRVYIVEKGDTLFDIAKLELGRPSRWKEIYDLNSDQLGTDFDHLSPGMKLILPDGGQSETITSKPRGQYK